ncbi:MAG: hypothetical protein ACJAUV_001896 [Flavobacteriales bacterium]|jgi:hypothetical protein
MRHIMLVFITLATGLILSNCSNKEKEPVLLFTNICDVESTRNDTLMGTNNQWFDGGRSRTKENSFSGEYSLKITPKSKYGFGINTYLNNQNHIVVTAWRKKCKDCGTFTIKTPNKELNDFYGFKIVEEKDGWEKIMAQRIITTPFDSPMQLLVFYYNNGENIGYVDDFNVSIYSFKSYPNYPELTQITLTIEDKEEKKLRKYAEEALKLGVLKEGHKKKVKAKLTIGDETYKVKIRLKGDWTDHLVGVKWSYRVELNEDKSVLGGLKEFSLQNPSTRHHTEEFFLHKLADKLGVLNTRYGFIQLKINKTNLGIYAFEEHFTKQLIESRKRREGPIVKFDEEPFWDNMRLLKDLAKRHINLPFYYASQAIPFGAKKISKSTALYNQFCQASVLMQQYKWGESDVSNIFDVDKLAMLLALCDFANIHHTMAWHNQRLYYNPVINKLEPILFDAFQPFWPEGPLSNFDEIIMQKTDAIAVAPEYYLVHMLLKNKEILKAYNNAVKKLLSEETKHIMADCFVDAKKYNNILQREFPSYTFDEYYFKNRLKKIDSNLFKFNEIIANTTYVSTDNKTYNNSGLYTKNINLVAFIDTIKNYQLSLENYHEKSITVTHLISERDTIAINIPAFNAADKTAGKYNFPLTKENNIEEIIYELEGVTYEATIYPWPKQVSENTVIQNYKANASIPLPHTLKNDTIWIAEGSHLLAETMTITAGKTLAFVAGTTIDITKNSKIISFGALSIKGLKDKPVKFVSSDNTGQGVVVLQAPSKSNLSYVTFDGLNTSLDRFWTLTGSVTFYESDVTMNHVTVKNNPCEDALNIIRSHFDINNLSVTGTASDGFDADYCTGIIDSSYFGDTGNDCIDVSTSEITISNITIKNSGDKGISGGEASTLHISNVSIDGAAIGIASKDKSELYLKNISISNAKYGLAAFQKKPEYGAANISAMQVTLNNVKNPFVLEKNSSIIWDGNINIGTKKLDVKQLYDL